MTTAISLDCHTCPIVAQDLSPGECVSCPSCGCTLRADHAVTSREPSAPSLPRMVDTLLRDAFVLALWLNRVAARAIALEPSHGPTREPDEGVDAAKEAQISRGKILAARLDKLDPVSAAVVRYLAERGGPARVSVVVIQGKSLGRTWHEILGREFANPRVLHMWQTLGDVRMPASRHGKSLLENAARAWWKAGVT